MEKAAGDVKTSLSLSVVISAVALLIAVVALAIGIRR
jgi:hypothetical protein